MKISNDEIKQILPSGFKLILDKEYILPTDLEVKEFISEFVKKRGGFEYIAEHHDCDNASIEMLAAVSGKGWAFALAIITDHAVCLYINDKQQLRYLDPYTGEIMQNNERLKVTVMP